MASLLHSPPFTVLMDPSPTHQPISRLSQMQARFQQRQLQEKEHKLLQMLEDQQQRTIQRVSGRGSAGSNTSSGSGSSTNSTGKVRQLFEERRSTNSLSSTTSSTSSLRSEMKSTSVGWDRSYPLDPMKPKTGSIKPPAATTKPQRPSNISLRPAAKPMRSSPLHDSSNGSSPFGKLSNVGARSNGAQQDSENAQQQVVTKRPIVKSLAEPKIKVAPIKRTSEAARPRPAPAAVTSPVRVKPISPPVTADLKAKVMSPAKPIKSPAAAAAPVVKHSEPCPAGMAECDLCGRRFADDRIDKHVEVCRKTKQKKRKTFDPVKMRTQGTEAESFVKSAGKRVDASKKQAAVAAASSKKGNWRQKHEDFIETIRQARLVKQILDSGGKLSDLPPPKPSDYSDYVQCPHCQRRFNESAAERHIPRCNSIKSNKAPPKARK